MNITIQLVQSKHLHDIRTILETTDLFPPDMLDDMISDFLTNPDTQELWLAALEDDKTIGFAYCAPEQLTQGTYNILAIAAEKNQQGKGIGSQLIQKIQKTLKEKQVRILLVDTSSTEQFAGSRKFYEYQGFTKEAIIRDYWEEGDDKVTYRKKL